MKADTLKFIASYFPYIPKIVSGVHVGIKDTEGPTIFSIFSIQKGPRYAKLNLFSGCQKQLTKNVEAPAFIITCG